MKHFELAIVGAALRRRARSGRFERQAAKTPSRSSPGTLRSSTTVPRCRRDTRARDGGYDTVSSFFTEIFGVGLKVFGDVSRFDEVATDGSLFDRDLVIAYGDGGRLVGALAVAPDDGLQTRLIQLIEARAPLAAALGTRALSGSGR
jgi:hypothetical protein